VPWEKPLIQALFLIVLRKSENQRSDASQWCEFVLRYPLDRRCEDEPRSQPTLCEGGLEESENLLDPDVFAEKIVDDFGVRSLASTTRPSKFTIDLRVKHIFALFTEDFLRFSAKKNSVNNLAALACGAWRL
jgi:hypothetical protein